MYEIKQNGAHLSYEDKARYVKLQANGTYCLCAETEAQGVVVNNDYIAQLDGRPALPDATVAVTIEEINGETLIADMQTALSTLGYTEG